MSQRETGSREKRRILEVAVQAQPGAAKPVHPRSITLTDSILAVVWRCDDLPPQATLQIIFRKDPRGPFFLLEHAGNEVIGWGNRGPETDRRYEYQVRIVRTGTVVAPLVGGFVTNHSPKPIPTTTYPPPEPIDQNP